MRRWLAGILCIFSVILLTISIYFLMGMFSDYRQEAEMHDRLKKVHEQTEASEEDDPWSSGTGEQPEETEDAGPIVDAGLLALHEQNPDCIYWITIPDTVIDYPVMYRPQDKDYYLRRDFDGEYSLSGTLYMEEDCDPVYGDNLIIYGHHMNSGAMFAALDQYKSEDFYHGHSEVILQTLHGEERYRILAAFATPVYTGHDFLYYGFTKTQDPNEYRDFVRECKERSYYETNVAAVYGQRLLTLSTCEYSHKNGRMVVVAVLEDS